MRPGWCQGESVKDDEGKIAQSVFVALRYLIYNLQEILQIQHFVRVVFDKDDMWCSFAVNSVI